MIRLPISPCPNDTFIFDAIIHHRIDLEGLSFSFQFQDVETLNQMALAGNADLIKVSFFTYLMLQENFVLLDSGSAMGFGNGPLLISKHKIYPDEIKELKIAIPGKYTTANLLLSLAYPQLTQKQEYLFSDIEEVILSGEMDAGVIIHENRFTYRSKGLRKIVDLGELWEQQYGLPIPLGGIIVKRNLPEDIRHKINRVLRRSVEYALQNPNDSLPFVRQHAQSMDESVMQSHIRLYVNDFSVDLGVKGREAIDTLYAKGAEKLLFPPLKPSWLIS